MLKLRGHIGRKEAGLETPPAKKNLRLCFSMQFVGFHVCPCRREQVWLR